MNKLTYRPEIDGLRAVAVMAVVLFHVGFGFSGGYVGVDVFFVISGFLITGLILKAQAAGEFSLRDFWLRRIRRLVPALVVLQLVVLAVGFWVLLPRELKDLTDSSIAQIFMVSNFYFADELDYFAGPAELMPLLHTWSLAVEEQFYLLLPLLLVFCRKLSRSWLFALLATVAAGSLAYSAWGVYNYPQHTFFLLPTRAWELLLGSLLVFAPPARLKAWVCELLAAVGIGGILWSSLVYNSLTVFPGTSALLPCLATALLIYATAGGKTYVGRLLATKPFVSIGLISYSLYLWHWPVIVFMKYQFGVHLSPALGLAAIALSFALGYLSWKYVETPFRRRAVLQTTPRLLTATAICCVAIVTVSGVCSLNGGLAGRWDPRIRPLFDNHSSKRYMTKLPEKIARDELPTLGAAKDFQELDHPSVLVWGDSHALRVYWLCDQLAAEHGITGYAASRGATVPLVDTWRRGVGKRRGPEGDAVKWNDEVIDFVKRKQIDHVILVARWEIYVEKLPGGNVHDSMIKDAESTEHTPEDSQRVLERGFQRTIAQLEEAGAKVWIMKQVPLQHGDPIRRLVDAANRGEPEPPRGVSIAQHLARQKNADAILEQVSLQGATLLDPAEFCFDEQGRSIIGSYERSYYFDDDHLSPHGAKVLLRPMFEPVFAQIAREKRLAELQGARDTDSTLR